MEIEIHNTLIEQILLNWKEKIGQDYAGYRGHVYRMFNFCLALHSCSAEDKTKLAIAACFHDIGLWSAHTVDYIPPSVAEVQHYLHQTGQNEWVAEISLMVEMHHKIRADDHTDYPLVELFRQGDLVDFSLGLIRFGLSKKYIASVKKAIPNQGFHRFLVKSGYQWFRQHPLSPPPFMKW